MHQSSYHRITQFMDLTKRHFKADKIKVLDVGSYGVNGTYREIFSDTNKFIYTGLDVNPGPNVDYVPQNPYIWPELEDEFFDVIISGQAFEHIEFPWLIINEMSRKLKKNGLICIVAPSRGPEHKYPVDCWRYYPDGFRALAKWAGLEVMETGTLWGASGFSDGSDQWGDTFCILHKASNKKPESCTPPVSRTTNSNGPLSSSKKGSYYSFARNEVVDAIVKDSIPAKRVLEVGCAGGATGKRLKELLSVDYYVGVEISEEAAGVAKQHLDKVIVGDIEKMDLTDDCGLKQSDFDLVLALDVLEHLYNPWDLLATLSEYLKPGGHVVASIPNIQNILIIKDLIKGKWKYEDAGILDVTHLRFFTLEEIERMFSGAGLSIQKSSPVFNPPIDISSIKETGNVFNHENLSISGLSKEELLNLFTHQYIIIAKKPAVSDITGTRPQEKMDAASGQLSGTKGSAIKKPLSVLLVAHNFLPHGIGGVEVYTYNMAKELIAKGCNVSVFYPVIDPGRDPLTIVAGSFEGIPVYRMVVIPDNLINSIIQPEKERAFSEFIEKQRFDVVHFQHTHGNLPLSLIQVAKNAGIPVILTLHDFWLICPRTHLYLPETNSVCVGPETVEKCLHCLFSETWDKLDEEQKDSLNQLIAYRQQYVKDLLQSIDMVTAASRFVADKFYSFDFGKDKILVSPLGLKPVKTADKKKGGGPMTFGYIGTISKLKNVATLIEAFTATNGNARLVIYGYVQDDIFKNLPNDKRIKYRGGYLPEQLPQILSEIDVIVVPSLIETYCFTVREALSAGIPVLAAKTGGIPEVVSDRSNGILFDPLNKEELRELIQEMIDRPETIQKLKNKVTPIKDIVDDAAEWLDRYSHLTVIATKGDALGMVDSEAEKIYGEIHQLINTGRYDDGIVALEKLLESYPGFALAHNDLGVLYFNRGDRERAMNHYEKAAQLNPENITFQKNLADFYFVVSERIDDALKIYLKILDKHPGDIETLLALGQICTSLNRIDDARFLFSKVLELEPKNISAIEGLKALQGSSTSVSPPESGISELSYKENLVSIVILTFNQIKYTKECVESIRKHTSELHEIVFVDNGSTDGTVKWLRGLVKENSHYKLIENKNNLGFAKGCNQGISASSGEYILLLNNDVIVTEGWLSGMIECLNSSPDIGIVGPMTNNISGPQKVENADYKSTDQVDIYAKSFKERNRHRRIPIRRIVGFCMLFKRKLVDKIGLLDECFGTGNFEDDDYCLRAALEGYRNMVAGDVFIHHYGSITFIGNSIDFEYGSLMGKNKDIFSKKWSGIDINSSIGKRLIALKAMEKADELNQTGQLDKAVDHILQEGIRYSPDDRRLYFAIAEILIDAKDFKGALDTINEMPGGDEDIKKLVLSGYCKQGMGLDDKAEQYADRALSLDHHSSLALNLKGTIAHKRGKLDAAEAFFNKSIESDNAYGEPYTNLGVMRWDAGEKKDGLDLLEKGVILSPKVTDSINLYHSAITEAGEFERAEKLFRELKPFYPMNKTMSFLLIDSLIKQGKNSAAMQEIERAMVALGVDDGILGAALEIRNNLGPHQTPAYADGRNSASLCMIVKNEELHIAKCLMSLKPIVDEIIIVDTGSTDRTKGIATAFGAKVFDFPWTGDFSDARNFSLSKASGQWIFVMDADEVISPLDYPAFKELVKKTKQGASAFKFVTRNYITSVNIDTWNPNDGRYILEEAGAGWVPSDKVRLFPNNMEIRFENPVHEMVEPSLKKLKMPVKEVAIPVHHYGKLSVQKSREKGEQYYLLGKKKLEETGGNLDAICELAIQAGELERYDEALELWQKAINIAPSLPVAFMNMGHIYLQKGDIKESLAASRMAMKLKPDYWEAISNYAIGELCGGDIKKSISALEGLLNKNRDYLLALGVLSASYCCNGQREKGLECFARLNQEQVAFSGLLSSLAKQLIAAGRVEYATLLLEAAVESNNINADIPGLLAECYHRVG